MLAFASVFFLPPRDITLKEITQSEAAHTSQKKPAALASSHLDSADIEVDEKVKTKFYIIVGSYKNLLKAQQKAETIIKDSNISIIVLPPAKEGFTRISYGEYSTLEEAKSSIMNVRTKIKPDAWILKRKISAN